ncbi:MAG: NADH-quinone oxidoreductase subunit M [Microscillaceae bacterium]|nr:NADH-quinone oxidoreductase subunit M [Microscillaceae bacterium]MDW8460566.1 NADH-quinone oxidoreductase subunit M [Cytophagales bacterium]
MEDFLLSILIFLPVLGSIFVFFLPTSNVKILKKFLLGILTSELILAFYLLTLYDSQIKGLQLVERQLWIYMPLGEAGNLLIEYFVGIDGLNVALVLLTALVTWIGAIASQNIEKNVKGYVSLYLLLTGSIMGCFVAMDFLLFYLFFEFMLLPMYFLIGIWGGERKEYASIKFFIYTLIGSLLILVVMIGLYLSVIDLEKTAFKQKLIEDIDNAPPKKLQELITQIKEKKVASENIIHTFSIPAMMRSYNYLPDSLLHYQSSQKYAGYSWRFWAFWLIFIGFAIKLPIVPLHTWLPDAHVEAPTPISVVLAGVLLKVGGYGILRTAYSIFPEVALQSAYGIGLLAMIAILYAGMVALGQTDFKKMIAYSSVSHMGFVLLGISSLTEEGVNGAIFQMVSHGILSAMLFIVVGVVYDRTHDRIIDHYRGLYEKMPVYTTFVMIAFFASLGLPAFSGFIGELFTLTGAFKSKLLPTWIAALSVIGILISAGYFLWTFQKMFLGKFWYSTYPIQGKYSLQEIDLRERFMFACLSLLTLLLGVYPNLVLGLSQNYVQLWLSTFGVLQK